MEYSSLVKEACEIHMDFAKEIYQVIENFLSRGENRVLIWVWQQEKPCAIDIVNHFGLSAGRVSNILKSLETKGLLFRKKKSDNRRIAYIILTEKGQKQAETIYQNLHDAFQEFFDKIGPEDALNFLNFEKKIMNMMRNGEITPDVKR